MTPKEPVTRIEADKPEAVGHLSIPEQIALEVSGEMEHATGPAREKLSEKAHIRAEEEK